MSSTDVQEEIQRLKTNVGVLAQALNTTLILFQGILAAEDWDSFCQLRDQVAPAVDQMAKQFQRAVEQAE
jgi:hypothetical protein